MKSSRKRSIWGNGPWYVIILLLLTASGMYLTLNDIFLLQARGTLLWCLRTTGALLGTAGLLIWFLGAVKSDIDRHVRENILVTKGIYGYVRHPIYSGFLFFFSGVLIATGNLLLLGSFPLFWFIMTLFARQEERGLLKIFGEEYRQYMKEVNRCIPWLPTKNKDQKK